MKNSRFLLLVGAVVFSVTTVFGQDYAFKVLANKGSNEIKSGDTWMAVKTGASLKKTDELKVAEGSYIGLVHSSGKPLELKASGSYKVADLESKVPAGNSVMSKYADFILSSNSDQAKNRMTATGAVHRGLGIAMYMPDNANADLYNNTVVVTWDGSKGGPYTVTFKNMFDEELAKVETPENKVQVDLSSPQYAAESAILVEVKAKGEKSEQHLIKKMNKAQSDKIKGLLTAELGAQTNEETALAKLMLASFYEQNKLYIDAIVAYEQAIKLAPDVPSYKEAYDNFLLRNSDKLK